MQVRAGAHKPRLYVKQHWHCATVQPNTVPQCGRDQTTPTLLTPNLTQQCAPSQGHSKPCLLNGLQFSAMLLWLIFAKQGNQQHSWPSSERLKTYLYMREYSTLRNYDCHIYRYKSLLCIATSIVLMMLHCWTHLPQILQKPLTTLKRKPLT